MMNKILLSITTVIITAGMVKAQNFEKFSHRGGRGLMPENTITAMENALDFGTRLEMDVYLSVDKQVFVYHDGVMSPVYASNADGSYVTKEQTAKKRIIEYTYPQLRAFDIGTRPNPEFPRKKSVKEHVPLLSELLDSVEVYAKRGGLERPYYSIEIKVPSGKLPQGYKQQLVDATIKIINQKNVMDHVIIQSFDIEALEYLHQKYPTAKTAYLVYVGKGDYLDNLKKLSFKPTGYSPYYKQVTLEMIAYCHKNGMQVITWTVDTRAEIEQMKAMGVDVVISDYPDYF